MPLAFFCASCVFVCVFVCRVFRGTSPPPSGVSQEGRKCQTDFFEENVKFIDLVHVGQSSNLPPGECDPYPNPGQQCGVLEVPWEEGRRPLKVCLGRDTRPSGLALCQAAVDGVPSQYHACLRSLSTASSRTHLPRFWHICTWRCTTIFLEDKTSKCKIHQV